MDALAVEITPAWRSPAAVAVLLVLIATRIIAADVIEMEAALTDMQINLSKTLHLFLVLFLFVVPSWAQIVGNVPYEPHTRVRVENGLVLTWQANQVNPPDEVKIYDLHGALLTQFGLTGLVPEATRVSVYDISAQPNKQIAVAAVYAKADTMPQGTLMLFDFSGNLKSTFALAPSRAIQSLVLDDQSNIWTLTLTSADQTPTSVPMVVEYDSSGHPIRQFLTRDTFPLHAAKIQTTPATGHPNMGYQSGTVWFWLPGSADLVTIRSEDGVLQRWSMGTPPGDGMRPMTLFRLNPDSYLLDARRRVARLSQPNRELYVWSTTSKSWAGAAQPSVCPSNDELVGVLDAKPLFLNMASHELCTGSLAPPQK